MQNLFNSKKALTLFTVIVLALFFGKVAFATPPASPYLPGETLNPICGPTDPNCDAESPLTVANIDDTIYGVSWDGDTTHAPSKNSVFDVIDSLLGGHNPVTLGTANGLSLSSQVLSLALASASATGALSNTDWITFNNKAGALGADDNYVTDAQLVVIGNTSGINTGDNTVATSGDSPTDFFGIGSSAYVTGGTDVAVLDGGTGLSSIPALSILAANSANSYVPLTPGAGNSIRINAGGTAWEAYTPSVGGGSQTPWTSAINAAGFTLNGNNAASGNLTLDSTSNATKGFVLLNPTGGNVGIGTTSPASKFHVAGGAITLDNNQRFQLTNSAGTANGASLFMDISDTFRIDNSTPFSNILLSVNGGAISLNTLGGTAIFENSGDLNINSDVYFINSTGNVGIGQTAPTAALHLKAGTATAGKAPLKLTAGTNLTATEAGAIEYDGTHLYFTATNVGTRYQLDQQAGGGSQTPWTSDINAAGFKLIGNTTTTGDLTLQTTSGVGTTGADMHFLVGNNGATEAMTILNSGNVGIGTITPLTKLHVNGAISLNDVSQLVSGPGITNAAGLLLTGGSGTGANGGVRINRHDNTVELMRVTNDGNVGIGVANPVHLLSLRKDQNAATAIHIKNTTSGTGANAGIFLSTNVGDFTAQIFKYSSTSGSFKTIGASDFALFNSSGGNISILNDFTSGNINLTAGGAGTSHLTVASTGNVGIGTVDPASKLHIEGSDTNGIRVVNTATPSTISGGGILGLSSVIPTAADQRLGFYNLGAVDSGIVRNPVSIAGFSSQPWVSGSAFGAYMTLSTTPNNTITRTEVMRLDQNGNVGIGTIAPLNRLHIEGTSAGTIMNLLRLKNAGTTVGTESRFLFSTNDTAGNPISSGISSLSTDVALNAGKSDLIFSVSNIGVLAERMRLISSGNLGIGDTTPDALLDVKGTVCLDLNADEACTDGTAALSDARLKTNVKDLQNGLELVGQLHPVRFKWNGLNNTGTGNSLGFLAQDVETIFPELVITDTAGYKNLDYGKLTAVLTSAVQELDLNLDGISGTITPLAGSANGSFVTAFFENVYAKITTWLADAGNGVNSIFANVFNAKEKICVDGECLTKDDVKALLLLARPASSRDLNSNPDQTRTEESAQDSEPEPENENDPAPAPDTEITPPMDETPSQELESESESVQPINETSDDEPSDQTPEVIPKQDPSFVSESGSGNVQPAPPAL